MTRWAAAIGAALIAALGGLNAAFADEPADLSAFTTANLLFDKKNYEDAASSYERLIGLGYEDPTLYYNLANAYYRTDDFGRALLNYLRASRLAPQDEDIAANLDLVRDQIGGAESRRRPALAQIAGWARWVSPDAASALALACWLALGALGAAAAWNARARQSSATRRLAALAIVGLAIFGALAVGGRVDRAQWERLGVVTNESAELFDPPSERGRSRLTLSAGREVELIETRAGWARVHLPNTDIEGWTRASDVEPALLEGR